MLKHFIAGPRPAIICPPASHAAKARAGLPAMLCSLSLVRGGFIRNTRSHHSSYASIGAQEHTKLRSP